jgi:branched-chain amino acid transport system ATP-binding protein
MLIIEHILSVIFGLSDRIMVLNFGERVAEGAPEEIAENPKVHEIYLGTKRDNRGEEPRIAETGGGEATDILSLRNVNSGYGNFQVLFDVSMDIRKGEIVALVGVNGSGKTSLIRTITRQMPLGSGVVFFNGESIARAKPYDIAGLGIAQCIEGRKLFPELTVEENLEIGAYSKRGRSVRRSTMTEVYELFPKLAERRGQIVSTLSGGEQQMVAIGRALMARPEFIIFDELSLGLAPIVIDILYEAIMKINRQGMTVLLVEQNVHRSLEVAHRAYIIEKGRIALSGTSEALAKDDHVRQAYFGL